ncbi:ribonuclease domain-containing protein [Bacillus sp. CGMCC 1.16541]|uniref:ribonuclease domain-containing protein n=1 Tax=Bacillus sp. CGMCC 1.16541 TaxID=2185143 RepID=UPI000D733F20|nr:ribonuclease domain-containing protein [Bacillus sp. CGMCC 1.16541]
MKRTVQFLASIAMVFALLFGGTGAFTQPQKAEAAISYYATPTDFAGIIEYLKTYGELPANFITKSEAQSIGWVSSQCNLATVAPGYSIGGDVFQNREGLLPAKSGRIYYEADAYYKSGCRGAQRVVYSNDGLYYTTNDHYKTFQRWY